MTHPRGIIIIADLTFSIKLGGLTLLERLLLNIVDVFKNLETEKIPVIILETPHTGHLEIPHQEKFSKMDLIHLTQENDLKNWIDIDYSPCLILSPRQIFSRHTLKSLIQNQSQALLQITREEIFYLQEHNPNKIAETLHDLLQKRFQKDSSNLDPFQFYGWFDSAASHNLLEKKLLNTLRKKTDGFASTHINRRLSLCVTKLVMNSSISPNQFSLFLASIVVLMVFVLQLGFTWALFLGTIMYDLLSILDGCDGELARLKHMDSKTGEWVDTLSDQFTNISYLFGLGWGLSRGFIDTTFPQKYFFWEGLSGALLYGIVFYIAVRSMKHKSQSGHLNDFGAQLTQGAKLPNSIKAIVNFISKLLKRDSYITLFVFIAALGGYEWILHALLVGIIGHYPAVCIAWLRRHKVAT